MEYNAKQLLDHCLLVNKPVDFGYFKPLRTQTEGYWKINGKEICKKKLIRDNNEFLIELELLCVLNPLERYLHEPLIIKTKNLIVELEKL